MKKSINISNRIIVMVALFMSLSAFVTAQSIIGPTTVLSGSSHNYSYSNPFILSASWSSVGGTVAFTWTTGTKGNTTYHATVVWGAVGSGSVTINDFGGPVETLNVTITSGGGSQNTVLSDENFVHTLIPQTATTSVSGLNNNEKIESVTYFDGLGRPMQAVGIRAGGNSEDIITHIEFDQYGRTAKEYLPYTSDLAAGPYRTGGLSETNSYYDDTAFDDDFPGMTTLDINPYSEQLFESAPLNRVLQQGATGEAWKIGHNHEIGMSYLSNSASDNVRNFSVQLTYDNTGGVITYIPSLQDNGTYNANELYKSVVQDENYDDSSSTKAHTIEEYKDAEGRVILKRTYGNSVVNGSSQTDAKHDTYYVYDIYGNLTYVIPPKVDDVNNVTLDGLCYQYRYDDRNRLVEKRIPGTSGWEHIVYNKLDQPVMTRNRTLWAQGKWLVTKYDKFGRVAYTGLENSIASRAYFQNLVNTHTTATQYEEKVSTGTGYLGTYYTNNAYPFNIDEILTVNYYDDYSFDLDGLTLPSSVDGQSVINYNNNTSTQKLTKGLSTGTKVKVLDVTPAKWITTIMGYDVKGRAIVTKSKNQYLGATDSVESTLDFVGNIVKTDTDHTKNSTTINIIDRFEYDHMDRLVLHKQNINSATLDEVIAEHFYDDRGQLETKGVGGEEGSSRLQDIDYSYNIRGWLTNINDAGSLGNDLFGFDIHYNNSPNTTHALHLYNGNIFYTRWTTANDNTPFSYYYQYDALNRLKVAKFAGGGYWSRYNVENITYDKNGNILSLKRKGHVVPQPDRAISGDFGDMDDLDYTYQTDSNKLIKVDDSANPDYGFVDGADVTTEYTYDDSGNMLTDLNKGISSNITYNYLNLPTQVTFASGNIQYIYDATGVKLKKIVSTGTTTEYAGSFIYQQSGSNPAELQMFSTPEGYVEPDGTNFNYAYQYVDHLGNIRLTYMDINQNNASNVSLDIIEENNYYPFGLKHKGYNGNVSSNSNAMASKFKYNGMELEESLGIDWYEMDVRQYDPALARWTALDPVLHYEYSPYHAFDNNPVFWADPSGADSGSHLDGGYGRDLHSAAATRYNFVDVVSHKKKKSSAKYKKYFSDSLDEIKDWILNVKTELYVWDGNVTSRENTPEGFAYVGKSIADVKTDFNRRLVGKYTPIGAVFASMFTEPQFGKNRTPWTGEVTARENTWVDDWSQSSNIFAQMSYGFANDTSIFLQSMNPFDMRITHLNGYGVTGNEKLDHGIFGMMNVVPISASIKATIFISESKFVMSSSRSVTDDLMFRFRLINTKTKYHFSLERHSFNTNYGKPIFTTHLNYGLEGKLHYFFNPFKKPRIKL
ncbi:DUF6443 domain-containing protein [Winogradskyella tangerina]|uniref:DUF6443 domain-containing protein n=1 Tax=Winogradskyella tangerina TaxID=2023240 RepID=UPI000DBE747B|nr:DUF6443 domain-containing protein [Winogradskyella tangerina]